MKIYSLICTLVIIVLLFLLKCENKRNVPRETFIKKDTIIKIDTVQIKSSPKVIVKNNTRVIHDTIKTKGLTMTIFDTLIDTFLVRDVNIISIDTTFKDTVFVTKIDTVIKNEKKWRYFKIGFGAGFVVGTVTNLFIKK